MSEETKNLGLFKYEPEIDGKEKFDINKALNNNFDKLDKAFEDVQNTRFTVNSGNTTDGVADLLMSGLYFESATAGTYNININQAGNYNIEMYGAGGGGGAGGHNSVWTVGSGGSGAGFKGVVTLAQGSYAVTVGTGGKPAAGIVTTGAGKGGDTILSGVINCQGGTGGSAYYQSSYGGTGGVITILDETLIVSSQLSSNGNNGNNYSGGAGRSVNGAASLYDNTTTGYGAGGYAQSSEPANINYCRAGINGYFKLSMAGSDNATVSFKVGGSYPAIKATAAAGNTFEVTSLAPIDMSGKADGVYNIDTSGEIIGSIYRQSAAPAAAETDVWLDTSSEPLKAFKYDGTQEAAWQPYDGVPIGSVTVASGLITEVKTFDFNQNGYHINRQTTGYRMPLYSQKVQQTWGAAQHYVAPCDGMIFGNIECQHRAYGYITIYNENDTYVYSTSIGASASGGEVPFCFPIEKGYKYSTSTGLGTFYIAHINFAPLKGV